MIRVLLPTLVHSPTYSRKSSAELNSVKALENVLRRKS